MSLTGLPWGLKMVLAVIWDALDFTIGRIPAFGTLFDLIGTAFTMFLWGPMGMLALWEVIEVTDQIDGTIPTTTLIGILTRLRGN